MPIHTVQEHAGIGEVVIDLPPVNAPTSLVGTSWPTR